MRVIKKRLHKADTGLCPCHILSQNSYIFHWLHTLPEHFTTRNIPVASGIPCATCCNNVSTKSAPVSRRPNEHSAQETLCLSKASIVHCKAPSYNPDFVTMLYYSQRMFPYRSTICYVYNFCSHPTLFRASNL